MLITRNHKMALGDLRNKNFKDDLRGHLIYRDKLQITSNEEYLDYVP